MPDELDSLAHYASKYYDPVKAHEYYMRTRELKGRRSSAKLDDEGKKAWSYTKNQIKEEKKGEIEKAKTSRDQKIEQYRGMATSLRSRISSRLKDLKTKLNESSKAQREQVDSNRKSKIESIDAKKKAEVERIQAIKMPSGLTDEQKAKWREDKAAELAKLREDAATEKSGIRESAKADKAKISEETKTTRKGYSDDASARRKNVSDQLKASVTKARENYKKAKEVIGDSYETIMNKEYDAILAEYAKPTKKKK